MKNVLWSLGKILQIIALIQVGAALYFGIQTNDATLELKLMLFGILEFLVGLILIRQSGRRE